MTQEHDVASHYSRGHLLDRLYAMLTEDGIDPAHPSIEALAPYDQFHGRGLEATVEMANQLTVSATDRLLDIGSGIGGPARFFADRFGCAVTGIDLTPEFCEVARTLTRSLDLQSRVAFEAGNALAMPFANGAFDGAYSMNVSMNIADKDGFYREIHRVLKPGGWVFLSEVAKGTGRDLDYPTPWASSARTSFLSTSDETRRGLEAAGFEIIHFRTTLDETLAFGARARAMVERGEKPPQRAVTLIHGDGATEATANMATGLRDARVVPIEVLGRRHP
jgi:ubiquinone/menaquinone biosynthesis C-methylase UbiE